jgi:hypothetical protein
LNFVSKVLFHILDNHDHDRKSDSKSLMRAGWGCNESRADVGPSDFNDEGTNVRVRESLDMALSDL